MPSIRFHDCPMKVNSKTIVISEMIYEFDRKPTSARTTNTLATGEPSPSCQPRRQISFGTEKSSGTEDQNDDEECIGKCRLHRRGEHQRRHSFGHADRQTTQECSAEAAETAHDNRHERQQSEIDSEIWLGVE